MAEYTIKTLIEELKKYPDNYSVTVDQHSHFNDDILVEQLDDYEEVVIS
jgi:hypothetical protein